MTEIVAKESLQLETLVGSVLIGAMLRRAAVVCGDEGPVLYRVPGWEQIQDCPQLFVRTEINGVEVPLVETLQDLEEEVQERAVATVQDKCYARVGELFNSLEELRKGVVAHLQQMFAEADGLSAPTVPDVLTRKELSEALSVLIPPLMATAQKWGDVKSVDVLEQLRGRLAALAGQSDHV